ncbi:MAG: cytochrome c3 family protein [bacterium]|nr:MAG: cytochrome c3 family protein [bacterium]
MSDRSGYNLRMSAAAVLVAAALVPTVSWAMRFSHKVHEEKGASECVTCHVTGAQSIIPSPQVCLPCHEEVDLEETDLGPTRTHTPLWVRQHGRDSSEPDAQCRSCHTLSFCTDCHEGGELAPDLTRRTVRTDSVPRSHTSRFRIVHPLKTTGGRIEECYVCHAEEFCSDCHDTYRGKNRLKTVSHRESWTKIEAGAGGPLHEQFSLAQCQDCHPDGALSSRDWSAAHAREAKRSLRSCQSCHPDGSVCKDCHSAVTGLRVSPHPRNWRSIQAKFRKEAPEVCAECH